MAVALGAAVRLSYVLPADFPLNDGALFYEMTAELRAAGYLLPVTTSYNSADIPYAYPPLAFYLAGLLADLTRAPLIELLRFQPLVVNLLTVGAFYLLARALLRTAAGVSLAVIAFALLPRSFLWLIMGGGLTRSLGFVFALLALWQAHALYTRSSGRALVGTTLCCSATALSHLEMAWFAAFSIALFFLFFSRQRAGLVHSLLVAGGTLLLTAPWWALVLLRHGPTVFLASGGSGLGVQGLLLLAPLIITQERTFPLLGALNLLGLLACLVARRWLLPAWLLAVFVLDPRGALTVASAPVALLASVGTTTVLLPLLQGRWPATLPLAAANPSADTSPSPRGHDPARAAPGRHLAPLVLGYLLVYLTLAAALEHRGQLAALTADERAAMRWVAEQTPPGARVVVVSGVAAWSADRVAEWFPLLAERHSVATVQGTEWLGARAFDRQVAASESLQRCSLRGVDCLEGWAAASDLPYTHVYVAKRRAAGLDVDDCCWSLRAALAADAGYATLYENADAAVFARRAP